MVYKLIFDKSSGQLFAALNENEDSSWINTSDFNVKTVTINDDEYWHGDYSSGSVVKMNDKPRRTETQEKYNTHMKILDLYPVYTQLNTIIEMLDQNSPTLTKTADFIKMKDDIKTLRDAHTSAINVYKNNTSTYTYISESEEDAEMKNIQDI
jgi:hypothetical protein